MFTEIILGWNELLALEKWFSRKLWNKLLEVFVKKNFDILNNKKLIIYFYKRKTVGADPGFPVRGKGFNKLKWWIQRIKTNFWGRILWKKKISCKKTSFFQFEGGRGVGCTPPESVWEMI